MIGYVTLYFFGSIGHFPIIFGLFLFIFNLIIGNIKFSYEKLDLILLFILLCMVFLSFLLLSYERLQINYLILYFSLLVFVFSLIFFNYKRRQIYTIVVFLFFVEFFSVLSQFFYMNFGFGLAPKSDLTYLSIQGVSLNPNNSASVIFLYYVYMSIFQYNQKKFLYFYIFSILAFITLILLASRTVIICFVLYFIFFQILSLKKIQFKSISYFFIVLVGLFFIFLNYNSKIYDFFNYEKILSISELSSDESSGFRLVSLVRLLESFNQLGLGTLRFGSYSVFYKSSDDWLMKINPHVFFSEYSFLFGYLGFFVSIGLWLVLILKLIKNNTLNGFLKFPIVLSIILLQAVPSSVLVIIVFIPMLMVICYSNYNPDINGKEK